jgi:hypothetical protein
MDKIAEIRRFVQAAELAAKHQRFGVAYALLSSAWDRMSMAMCDCKEAAVATENTYLERGEESGEDSGLDNSTPF